MDFPLCCEEVFKQVTESAPDTLAMDNNKCVKTEDSQERQLNILSARDNLQPFVHNQKNKIQYCLVCSPAIPEFNLLISQVDKSWQPLSKLPIQTGVYVYIYTNRKEVQIYVMSCVVHE